MRTKPAVKATSKRTPVIRVRRTRRRQHHTAALCQSACAGCGGGSCDSQQ